MTTRFMESTGRLSWWLRLMVAAAVVAAVKTEPQTNFLAKGCGQDAALNETDFANKLNAAFSDLRGQLSGGSGRRFATALQAAGSSGRQPVYTMVQCRSYMSEPDCLACYDFAVDQIRNCSRVGARIVYDGCFLRYEDYNFYSKTIENSVMCGNRSSAQQDAFSTAGQKLLTDLQVATPRINGYSAAAKTEVSNNGVTVYGVAQCAETVSQNGCQGCLNSAYESINVCFQGSTEGRLVDASCFMRYSDIPFFDDNRTTDLTSLLSVGGGGGREGGNTKGVVGGVVGGVGVFVVLVALIAWYAYSRSSKAASRGHLLGATELQRPNVYNYKELKAATDNFSEENKLGEGSFGVVYKATLRNGNVVAVKKLNMSYSRAKADFESESRLISNVHHRNLVRLLGCCSKGSELLLIYDYMENGSLDTFLYGEKGGCLSWKHRVNIIYGIARGIAYLHEHYHVTIIHRDIKPSNILVDAEFQAKIADFGLARLLPGSQTHVNTKFAGTLGYTAPEYAVTGHLSEKVDVYSFGIVVLEIISGRRCSDHMNINSNSDSNPSYLLKEALNLYESGMHEKLADETLDLNEYKVDDLKKMVEIGLICTRTEPSSRPSMSEIVGMMLSNGDGGDEQKAAYEYRPSFNNASASNATASFSDNTGR